MKKGNLEYWENTESCINLLFFSQLVNELLFDYSIPSNRISTLNSHYLCYDAISTINSIEDNGVPEGTLKPIVEELYVSLQKDPSFREADDPTKYFVKYQDGKYRITSKISDLNYSELKNATFAIRTRFFQENNYYELLKSKIIDIVLSNDQIRQPELFRLVKSLLTELINSGYSTKYIHNTMNSLFWNPTEKVDTPQLIHGFFSAFNFAFNEYQVIFVVNKRIIQQFVAIMDNLELMDSLPKVTNQESERRFLDKGNRYSFLRIKTKALDPYSAARKAQEMLAVNMAFYRLYNHEYNYDIYDAKCGVYDNSKFYYVTKNISGVSHTRMMTSQKISESMDISEKALNEVAKRRSFDDYTSLIHAALFHSHSLSGTSSENQLLDLWAIFESVLQISNKHTSDRINQVCMFLIPMLKRRYIYSLFWQLANDMKNFDEESYNEIVKDTIDDSMIVQRICEFILMPDNEAKIEVYLSKCEDFPLLKERINYYKEMLSTPKMVYDFVEKHADRVRWQVMRIYRNRNLIVHNGESMPYLDLLIENLHSYVDDFLSYVIHNLSDGHTVNSMCQLLFAKECEWGADFQRAQGPMTIQTISKMLAL